MCQEELLRYYEQAKDWVSCSPFRDEITWQKWALENEPSESIFLQEYAWVVLNSGFRESVVRKHFDYISLCFFDWSSADEIAGNGELCVVTAQEAFANRRKLSALVATADEISSFGFDQFWADVREDPLERLAQLSFIGEVTKWHLAKNLGINVAKPDRHLVRIAGAYGYRCVHSMCEDAARHTGDPVAVVDLILWRHAEQFYSTRHQTAH